MERKRHGVAARCDAMRGGAERCATRKSIAEEGRRRKWHLTTIFVQRAESRREHNILRSIVALGRI